MELSSLDINAPNLGKDFTDHRVFNQLDDLMNFYDMFRKYYDSTIIDNKLERRNDIYR